MRNDSSRWAAPQPDKQLSVSDLSVRQVLPRRMTLISGPYSNITKYTEGAQAFGWPDIVSGSTYALRLRRDRVLLVEGPAFTDGWADEAGVAISDMTGAYCVFEIKGSGAMPFLQRGTEIDPVTPSASVNRAFHGLSTMMYKYGDEATYRVQVTAPMQEAFWKLAVSTGQQT